MLKIQNLHAKFEETEILKGVNLEVNPGEIHIILGPNGSGKSTLGRVLIGDFKYERTEGKIFFENENFEEIDISERARKGFFYSFQSPPEIDGVRVKDFLFAAKKSMDPEFKSSFKFKKELGKILEDLRLPAQFMDRETNMGFSGGERKKLEMVSMILLNPKCIFLDEIDSGVDVDTIRQIGKTLRIFLEDKSKSLILVSHSEKLLSEISPTHVHIFCHGHIIKSGGKEIIEKVHKEGFDEYLPKKSVGLKVLN